MRRTTKVVLAVGVAGVVLGAGWGAWTNRPMPTRVETYRVAAVTVTYRDREEVVTFRQGERVGTRTWTRSYRWLARSEWDVRQVQRDVYGPGRQATINEFRLGVFAVVDTHERSSIAAD